MFKLQLIKFNKYFLPIFLLSSQPTLAGIEKAGAEEIFKKSVKIFAKRNIQFTIDSTTTYVDGHKEQRTFFLATKKLEDEKTSTLIRFLQPEELKCTAVLINKHADTYARYVYFPSLNRLRVIPESDKQKEIFGIGISYEELNHPKGQFQFSTGTGESNDHHYEISLVEGDNRSDYRIEASNFDLKEINLFKQAELQKRIKINKIDYYFGERIITSWEVHNPIKNRSTQFTIRPESISVLPEKNIFYKNRLKRCVI